MIQRFLFIGALLLVISCKSSQTSDSCITKVPYKYHAEDFRFDTAMDLGTLDFEILFQNVSQENGKFFVAGKTIDPWGYNFETEVSIFVISYENGEPRYVRDIGKTNSKGEFELNNISIERGHRLCFWYLTFHPVSVDPFCILEKNN